MGQRGQLLSSGPTVLHLFVMNYATGEPSVLLVEREPGVVEFPAISVEQNDAAGEAWIEQEIETETGLKVTIGGYLDPPAETPLSPPGSRFLVARVVLGRPQIRAPHVGWEWRPAASLLSLQFVPRLMVNELRSYMNR